MADDEQLFQTISVEMSDGEKLARLEAGEKLCQERERAHAWEPDWHGYTLSSADEEAVRGSLADPAPAVRAKAVYIVGHWGDADWEDFRLWFLDPDKVVREEAMSVLDLSKVPSDGDKEQFVGLLEASWKAYPEDIGPGISMSIKATSAEARAKGGWLGLTWRAAERLLDLDNEQITDALVCGYFEDTIRKMGPDDPHIRPWIEGTDKRRKDVLLGVANWLGLRRDNLRAIVEALANDVDSDIAKSARGVLAFHTDERK